MLIPYNSCPNCPEFSATFGAFANLFNVGMLGVTVVLSPNVQTFSARAPCVIAGFNARVCSAAPLTSTPVSPQALRVRVANAT